MEYYDGMDGVDRVVKLLEAIPRSEWEMIALESGVPLSTIQKTAYRVTKRPSFSTIDKLQRALDARVQGTQ